MCDIPLILHSPLLPKQQSSIIHKTNIGWPGFTYSNVSKYLTETTATTCGHIDQECQGLQSTNLNQEPHIGSFPPKIELPTNDIIATIVDFRHTNKAYFDLMGTSPYPSSSGNEYVFLLYDYDSNAILVKPMKTHQGAEITRAWKDLHQVFHSLSGLATVDPTFPITKWDRLLTQATITLNLLQNSCINPRLSAYAYVYGQYGFNSSPMAPPGTKVVIRDKPQQRASWQYHGSIGFYIAPSVEHYRCMQCYIPSTHQVQVADTIQFFPHHIDFPALSLNKYLLNALDTIAVILRQKHLSPNDTSLQIAQSNMDDVRTLTEILRRCTPPPLNFNVPPSKLLHGQIAAPSTVPLPTTPKAPVYEAKLRHRASLVRTPSTTPKFSSIGPVCENTVCPSKKPISAQLPRVPVINRHKGHTTQSFRHLPRHAQQHFLHKAAHIFDKATGKKLTLRQLLKNPATSATWSQSASNEFSRLVTGNDAGVEGTQAMCMVNPIHRPDQQVHYIHQCRV